MNDYVLQELAKNNLCTYFILPLVKLSKFRFTAESNFINCYLTTDGKDIKILVNVKDVSLLYHQIAMHPNYDGVYQEEGNDTWFISYIIPSMFDDDIYMFTAGKFSSMSNEARKHIVTYSGLPYKVFEDDGTVEGMEITDIRLLALEKSEFLRDLWEKFLDITISDDNELLSIPPKSSYRSLLDMKRIEF